MTTKDQIDALIPVFANASVGDFSANVPEIETEEDLSMVFTGVQIMLEVIRQKLSDLKLVNDSLTEEVEKTKAIVASIGDGVIITDRQDTIVSINQSAQRLFRLREAVVVGRPLSDFLKATDAKGNKILADRLPNHVALTTQKAISKHFNIAQSKGSSVPIAVRAFPISFHDSTIGAIGVYRDISRELEVERLKQEFVSLAAHQLRGPLAITRWSVELLTEEEMANIPDSAKEKIKNIYESNKEMIALVNDLLDVSRIDQNRVPDNPEATDVVASVQAVMSKLQNLIQQKNLRTSFHSTHDSIKLLIDPKRFSQVIENIILNAIKFNKNGGSIQIGVALQDQHTVIKIADTGIGIPQNELSLVWTKFYRASNAVKTGTSGTGLGLFMVKSYIEGWGGGVSIESKENSGTTLTIQMPLNK